MEFDLEARGEDLKRHVTRCPACAPSREVSPEEAHQAAKDFDDETGTDAGRQLVEAVFGKAAPR